jgi:glycerate kinase
LNVEGDLLAEVRFREDPTLPLNGVELRLKDRGDVDADLEVGDVDRLGEVNGFVADKARRVMVTTGRVGVAVGVGVALRLLEAIVFTRGVSMPAVRVDVEEDGLVYADVVVQSEGRCS